MPDELRKQYKQGGLINTLAGVDYPDKKCNSFKLNSYLYCYKFKMPFQVLLTFLRNKILLINHPLNTLMIG